MIKRPDILNQLDEKGLEVIDRLAQLGGMAGPSYTTTVGVDLLKELHARDFIRRLPNAMVEITRYGAAIAFALWKYRAEVEAEESKSPRTFSEHIGAEAVKAMAPVDAHRMLDAYYYRVKELETLLTEAYWKMYEAHDSMFTQCCSNPVYNAWQKEVDVTAINAMPDTANAIRKLLKINGKADCDHELLVVRNNPTVCLKCGFLPDGLPEDV